VGLFYAEGYFRQRLDESGWQREDYATTDVNELPLDRAMDNAGQELRVRVRTRDSEITAGVWTAHVGETG